MTALVCVAGSGLGVKVAVTPAGSPPADSWTFPLDPLRRATVTGTSVVIP
jgi:hypothetical protein